MVQNDMRAAARLKGAIPAGRDFAASVLVPFRYENLKKPAES